VRKNAKKFIELQCCHCQKTFRRELRDYTARVKKGKSQFYCGNSCSAKANPGLLKGIEYNRSHPEELIARLTPFREKAWEVNRNGHSRADEYSPFRYFAAKARNRKKHLGSNVDIKYLKSLWDTQSGVCPYTGKKMTLPCGFSRKQLGKATPWHASLDRIDTSKGYVQGNVEFVCLAVNYAKNVFTKDQMLEFFKTLS
jgi:hypothetical protein